MYRFSIEQWIISMWVCLWKRFHKSGSIPKEKNTKNTHAPSRCSTSFSHDFLAPWKNEGKSTKFKPQSIDTKHTHTTKSNFNPPFVMLHNKKKWKKEPPKYHSLAICQMKLWSHRNLFNVDSIGIEPIQCLCVFDCDCDIWVFGAVSLRPTWFHLAIKNFMSTINASEFQIKKP